MVTITGDNKLAKIQVQGIGVYDDKILKKKIIDMANNLSKLAKKGEWSKSSENGTAGRMWEHIKIGQVEKSKKVCLIIEKERYLQTALMIVEVIIHLCLKIKRQVDITFVKQKVAILICPEMIKSKELIFT